MATTLVLYGGISVDDAELSIGAVPRGQETDHEAFLRQIKDDTRGRNRKKYKKKKRKKPKP